MNAGAALYTAGAADTIREGIELAGQAIDEGKAMDRLRAMIRHSTGQKKTLLL